MSGTGMSGTGMSGAPGTGYALDAVSRLHIMAAGVRGARIAEHVVAAPLAEVWAVMADLEGEFGRFQPDMRGVRILRVSGDRVEALARSKYGLRAHLRGVLRPGWCWLQSRFLIIGMAAAPEPGGGTRVALTGGVRVPGRAAIVPFGTASELARAMARLGARVDARGGPGADG
ncbi:hypothetical protein [Streptomyces sp. ISL-86]|uniref:hypothetical protein n=1 Tax=Streptomyces sp. ISL-86 TaxID=2819187 RepID=UPI002034B8EA|nr:hypothetical protein [Streptomyces sp. ISL-86]